MKHQRDRRRDDIHPAPGGPYVITIYCHCGQSFTHQDRSKANAYRAVNRKLQAHLRSLKRT